VAANLSAFFLFGAFFSFLFLGSLFMQQVLGSSPTRTGVSWLATSATSFIAAGISGAKLVEAVGVRRLLVAGLSLLALSALLLTRVPAGGNYATDLLPALLLAGVAGGLSAPSAQIGALAGVTHSMTGLASGLVETMREIGGAVGVAAVSTVLVSGSAAGDASLGVDDRGVGCRHAWSDRAGREAQGHVRRDRVLVLVDLELEHRGLAGLELVGVQDELRVVVRRRGRPGEQRLSWRFLDPSGRPGRVAGEAALEEVDDGGHTQVGEASL
jgi:hypothetical protein